MKTISIKILNGTTVFERELTSEKIENTNQLLGTALNDFFSLVNLQADKHVKLFKFNEPFDLIIKTDKLTVDTTKIATVLKSSFKLNKTAKRKRKFASTVHTLVNFVTAETQVKTVDEVLSELVN